MDIDAIDDLKNLLRQSGLKPKNYLGQNFLVDRDALEMIVQSADLKKSDTVLEVGPGLGVLTEKLLDRGEQVIAVEKDRDMVNFLSRRFRDRKNLKIVSEDILKYNLNEIEKEYKLVANIPYYLTSKLIQNFLNAKNKPSVMILMIQKEVGERIVAAPGELSILGLSVQIYADTVILLDVSKESFWPVPKVDSVILKITPRLKYPEITEDKVFFRLIKIAFAGKRKQIQNTLVNGLKLPKDKVLEILLQAGIESSVRPQDLEISQWIRLYQVISQLG